jgi:hypothetical protein
MAATIKEHRKPRIDKRKCVVCGAPPAGYTGYIFFESGTTRMYAPFCKEHLENNEQFAKPVFENLAALNLFKQMHPATYWQDVHGKTILFFTAQTSRKIQ